MNEMELQTTLDPIEMDMGDPEIIYSPVLPNPVGDPTDDLTKVTIQGDIYKIKDPEVHEWARAEEKPTYTKEEVGLGNVDNTSDMDKPVSTATQTALNNKVDKVAGKGLSTNDFTNDFKTKLEGIEAGAEVNTVNSVAGKTGNVTLDKTDVGLSNVDNTSDLNKPVSTATQSALNGKVDNSTLNSYYTKTETDSALANKVDKIDGKGLSTNDYDDTAKGIVDGVTSALNGKVDKEEGYGLSQNDYSDEEKAKVGEIDNKLDKTETAVNSNGLVIATPVNDNAPYIYRQTPVKESFKALMKKIVGASVVWNQLVDSNTTSVTIASGHRYIAKINGTLTFGTSNGSAIAVDGSRNDYFTDITSAFNTTIADYVYTLEQATAGSGIAWLQSYGFFTEDYYAYTQNTIESVNTSGRKVVGKNLCVEVIDNALSMSGSSRVVVFGTGTTAFIECKKGYTYTVSGAIGRNRAIVGYFDDIPSLNEISVYDNSTESNGQIFNANTTGYSFTAQYNGIAGIYLANAVLVNVNIQVEIGSTATSFEPYTETTYPISPITLRGLFKLSTDKLTVDGDEYNADGSVERKFGVVDLGSLDWNYDSSAPRFMVGYSSAKPVSANSVIGNLLCEKYTTISLNDVYGENTNKAIAISTGSYISIVDKDYTNPQIFKTAMSGVYLIYELATPTTEQTTPFTETEIVGSTEEFIDYEVAQSNRDVAIPVGTDTDYYQEMKLPPLPTTSGNHNLIYNPSTGFGWS